MSLRSSMTQKNYLINIVIVLFNNIEEVIKYVLMLSKQSIFDRLLISIVINFENKNHTYLLKKSINDNKFTNIQIFNPKNNIGYLNSLIYSFNNTANSNKTLWYILSNTDISINDEQFFQKILENSYDSNIWSIGPSIYSEFSKSYDNPQYLKRTSIKKLNLLIFVHKHLFLSSIYHFLSKIKHLLTKQHLSKSRYVYSNHGGFMILKEGLLQMIKNNLYSPIMYSEELFLSEIVMKEKKLAYYDSSLSIIHRENSTTGLLKSRVKIKFIHDSLVFNKQLFYLKK